MKTIYAILLSFILALALQAASPTSGTLALHVAPDGNDAWSGVPAFAKPDRSDGPLATPQCALQRAREDRARRGAGVAITIQLRGGIYRLTEPLVLTPADSGTRSAPLTIEALPGPRPVLSGGRAITGWTVSADGRWHAVIPEARDGKWIFHQLFVNGQRRFRPRLPRKGYYHVLRNNREQEQGSSKFVFEPGQLKAWPNLGEVELIAYHQWISSRHYLQSVDTQNNVVTMQNGAHWLFGTFEPRQRFYLENVASELGAPGDWYLNRTTGELTYCPMPGEDPQRSEVVAPVLRNIVRVEGDPANGKFVQDVILRGLTLADTARGVSAQDMANENQSSIDGFAAAVEARGLQGSQFIDCEITRTGEHGLWLHEGSRGNRVEHCHLHDLGGGGVYIGEAQIQHEGQSRVATADTSVGENQIVNNYIHDGGYNFPAGVGVFIGHSAGNRVVHNEISAFNHLGVSVGRVWGYGPSEAHHNQIEFNRVHHIANGVLSDAGAIYMLGTSPGTTIRNNVVHHVTPFNSRLLGNGIYLDEGSSQIKVENNLVHDVEGCAFLLHYGHRNEVRNNIFDTRGSSHPFNFRRADDKELQVTFERNILYDRGRDDWFPKFAEGNFVSDYNLFWDAAGRMPLLNHRTLPEWQKLGRDQHSIFVDPQFENPARKDFRLKPGSPIAQVGFVPFNPDEAGLQGDAEWVKLPTHYPDRAVADRTPPPPPAMQPIRNDFEGQAVNEWPWDSITWSMLNDKRNVVTNEAAAGGKQSLRVTTSYTYYNPWLRACAVHVELDVMQNKTKPGRLDLQLRDWSVEPYKAGPYMAFMPDGSIDAQGVLTRVPLGTWMHVEIDFELRPNAPGYGQYRLRVTPAGGAAVERTMPFDAGVEEISWFGLVGNEAQPGVTYIDNLVCEPLADRKP